MRSKGWDITRIKSVGDQRDQGEGDQTDEGVGGPRDQRVWEIKEIKG